MKVWLKKFHHNLMAPLFSHLGFEKQHCIFRVLKLGILRVPFIKVQNELGKIKVLLSEFVFIIYVQGFSADAALASGVFGRQNFRRTEFLGDGIID
jgi:hypothetical protein